MYRKPYIWLIVVLVTTFLFLSSNLKNELLNWDDPAYIINNPLIKDSSFNGIKNIFLTKEVVGTYSPLVLLSWSIDYAVSGLNPFTFHLFNLLFHLIVVALVFYLTLLLSKRIEVAFITSMLFGIHPMHVEVVGWISARKDLIYTLFFLAGLIVYHFYIENKTKYPKWYYYLACLTLFFLSLLSKGTAVTFPFILLLFDYLKRRNDIKKIVLEKTPFFLLSFLFVYIAIIRQSLEGAMESGRLYTSVFDSLSVGFYGYLTYLIKSIFPFHLSAFHPYPNAIEMSHPWYLYASAIPIISLFIITVIKAKTHRFFGFGIAFFFISLIPVIQVLPFGLAVTADRYTYLPYFGLFFIFALVLVKLLDNKTTFKKSITVIILVYFLTLGSISFQYSKTFKNGNTLWSNVIDFYPNNSLAYLNRGNYKTAQLQHKEAIFDFSKGFKLNSKDYSLLYNRGLAYQNIGEYQQAIKDYTRSISLNPNHVSNFLNRGIAYNALKNYNKAILDFDKAIQLNPELYKGYYNRAMSFISKGMYDKAIQDLSSVISLKQIRPLALTKRGEILLLKNQKELALSDFNKAIDFNPKRAATYVKRGLLYLNKKDFYLAEKDFKSAINLDNTIIEASINLGVILMNNRQYNSAIEYFNMAQKLDPNNYIVYYNRGLLQLLNKNYAIALEEFGTCLKLNPNFMLAKKDREKTLHLLQEKEINLIFPK